jgi:hypothetical protein
MVGPNQPLDIDGPPTQLLAVDDFVARLADPRFGLLLGLGFGLALYRQFTPW